MAQMTRELAAALRPQIAQALKEVAERNGLVSSIGGGTYDTGQCTWKIEFAAKNTDGTVMNKDAMAFKTYAHRYGFKPEDLFVEFNYGGRPVKIIGCRPRKRDYPIVVQTREGIKLLPAMAALQALRQHRGQQQPTGGFVPVGP